jgi:hypothetical protein
VIKIVKTLVDRLNTNGTKYLLNHVRTRSALGFVTSVFFLQQKTSHLFALILFWSSTITGMKRNIYKMKSVTTARPATKQNDCRAGISVELPMKKARASQKAATNIDGPISFNAKAARYSTA